MTKSSGDGTVRTFATLRITGDNLIPDEVTDTLGLVPSVSYRKGEDYVTGKSPNKARGKTGVWYFETDKIVSSHKLADHIDFLLGVLCPEGALWGQMHPILPSTNPVRPLVKLEKLKRLLDRREMRAAMTLFWHGTDNAKQPVIPRVVSSLFRQIPVSIETDFDTDEDIGQRVA